MYKVNEIAGVDEVGRGSLAGPVFAAAVILNKNTDLKIIKDSKKITFKNRILISKYIKKNSIFAISSASVEEINKVNILNASLLAMGRALNKLNYKPKIAYIDGIFSPKNTKIKCKTFIKGDENIKCIAAASIIAKVARDLFMINLSTVHQNFKWEKNFGYGTKQHLFGLKKYGITKYHRRKFKPVLNVILKNKRET